MKRWTWIGQKLLRSVLYFFAACTLLFLLWGLQQLSESILQWVESIVTVSGARLNLHLGNITLAFDRNLLAMIAEKWSSVCTASAKLLPPGVENAMKRICAVIGEALKNL